MKKYLTPPTDITEDMMKWATPLNEGKEIYENYFLFAVWQYLDSRGFNLIEDTDPPKNRRLWSGSFVGVYPFVKESDGHKMYVVVVRTSDKPDCDDGMETFSVLMYSSGTDMFDRLEEEISQWFRR